MTNKDILYKSWDESNVVWTHDGACKIDSILDVCNIEIDCVGFLRQVAFPI